MERKNIKSCGIFLVAPPPPVDPCTPSPCGLYAECRVIGDQAACSCLKNYIGLPPNCRPECVVNTDCASNQACISEKCRDPCIGSCGENANCRVQNHIPVCLCQPGFTGDPFSLCSPIIGDYWILLFIYKKNWIHMRIQIYFAEQPKPSKDLCNPSPCGPNAECNEGICTCLTNYFGDPYSYCRPECTMNSDCSRVKACVNHYCVDPCEGTCGTSAKCDVVNHIPMCSCLPGTSGDPFTLCRPHVIEGKSFYILLYRRILLTMILIEY